MPEARLDVTDALGRRLVVVDKPHFALGRREASDLRLVGSEISRDHAQIVADGDEFVLRDRGSRYGTFVNGEPVSERRLRHGDRIRLGRTGGAELVFLLDEAPALQVPSTTTTTLVGDLRQVAALLEGLRALGSGRVLDEVLALVMDAAIEVSGAERGFIMLADPAGRLEFKLARARGRQTLPGRTFETSRKIPEQVFERGETRIVADLLDGELASAHMGTVALGIRHVLCVPLRLLRYLERPDQAGEERRIGVLYLDSRERGTLLSNSTRAALETLATEAAVAIENARLYREAIEKARLEQEMRIAAEIQQALLPGAVHTGEYFEAVAATLPCRAIGGDFYDYIELVDGRFGFALGDVAGKGAPAALLSAMLGGIFLAQATATDEPAVTVARINQCLVRRAIEARFVTLFYGILAPDGRLVSCNAGHNPPLVLQRGGLERLARGGPILGLFDGLRFEHEARQLEAGDLVVVFSDGVSEALSARGEEFGEARLVEAIGGSRGAEPREVLEALFDAVGRFTAGAPRTDDVTAMVVRYRG
jgi:sigma-B regulation protein RsbU (phosphoserine phosphatase)